MMEVIIVNHYPLNTRKGPMWLMEIGVVETL